MSIRLQHNETETGKTLYVVLYNWLGTEVYDESQATDSNTENLFTDYSDEDNPSLSTDPNGYGVFMDEDAIRTGWYYLDFETLPNGTYTYEVWETDNPSGLDRDYDTLRAVNTFTVKANAEYTPADISIAGLSAIEDLSRSVTRAANKAGRQRRR